MNKIKIKHISLYVYQLKTTITNPYWATIKKSQRNLKILRTEQQ